MNQKKSYKWPLIIVSLLVVHVVAMIVVAAIATSDRSFAVVPNYYQEAIHWDQTKALKEASAKLGWKAEIIVSATEDAKRDRLVALRVTDATGQPVNIEKAQLKYFHFSHAKDANSVTLAARDGKIEGTIPLRYEGFYEFNLMVSAGESVFVDKVTQYVNAATRE